MLSYIRDLIEQLNRALREVTFDEDRCLKGAPQRLSPRGGRLSAGGNEAITTSGIRKTTHGEGDDCTRDVIPDQHEIGITLQIYLAARLLIYKGSIYAVPATVREKRAA